MIPYAILSGEIYTSEDRCLDIRLLELSDRHGTFRLPKAFLNEKERISSLNLSFYEMSERAYHHIFVESFSMTCLEKDEFYDLYRFDCQQENFRQAATKLTREYLSYMENRLFMEDGELSASMTDYPKDGDAILASSMEEQKALWSRKIKNEYDKDGWDELKLAYSLENKETMEHFLKEEFHEFCKWYWEHYDLSWHPLAKILPKKMIIGNPYCSCLFPDQKDIEAFFKKTNSLSFDLAFQLAPVSQSFFSKMTENLDWIAELARENHRKVTIYVGDQGIKEYLIQKYEDSLLCKDGVLMRKYTRDPRLGYRKNSYKNPLINESKLPLHTLEDGLCLPFYQCNTGTFCPLYSLSTRGKRDGYVRVLDCPRYCQDHFLIYPSHLNLLGRYNSILGWNSQVLCRGDMIRNQKEWMVINL